MAEFLVGVLALGAGIFTASASGKLRSRMAYRDYDAGLRAIVLLTWRRLPVSLRNATPMILAAAETAAACALAGTAGLLIARPASGYGPAEAALAAATGLTAVLTGGVAVTVRRGITAACRCFGGATAQPLGIGHVLRNAFLLVLFAAGTAAAVMAGGQHARPSPAGSALAVLAGLLVALLVARWDDLASLLVAQPVARGRTTR